MASPTVRAQPLNADQFIRLSVRSKSLEQLFCEQNEARACVERLWYDPLQFSPNETALCQPRPVAWVTETIRARRPNGAAPNSSKMRHPIDDDEKRLGSPRWGYLFVFVTVTQADGLGWHRAATLWREPEQCVTTFSTA